VVFVIVSVIYRPIEQYLSRMIAHRRAVGYQNHPLRTAALLQFGFAIAFIITALALHNYLVNNVFHSQVLYWILVTGVTSYSVSFFARGWLAGHKQFVFYGALLLLESFSRFLFAFAALVGITHGQSVVAMGIAMAPLISLVILPFALTSHSRESEAEVELERQQTATEAADAAMIGPAVEGVEQASASKSLKHGISFTTGVFVIMLAEQTLLNAAVLTVAASSNNATAGYVFNAFLIVRAPLLLFQAIQTSLLPHLAQLEATEGKEEFHNTIAKTVLVLMGLAGLVALCFLLFGPLLMDILFGGSFDYGRGGLALLAVGMGFHLAAGTLNQAALARQRAVSASILWLLSAVLFLVFLTQSTISDQLLRVEVGYFGATALLSASLFVLYLFSHRKQEQCKV
jgi:O-antigen/teichoic acid export membrane protein